MSLSFVLFLSANYDTFKQFPGSALYMSSTQAAIGSDLPISGQRSFWPVRLFAMVLVGFILRFGFVLVAHTYRFKSAEGNFGFGYEMGRIAAALASGHGFSNPFQGPTGPTAWEPPLYPFIIAGAFKLTGIYTAASSIILLAINSLFSALTTVPVFYLTKRSFGLRIATWSAWTWTLLPYAMYWSVKWIWETSLAQFLLVALLLLAWRLAEGTRLREWACWGLLWGIAALLNPSLLSVLPFLAGRILIQRRRGLRSVFAPAALSAATFIVVIAPWLVRNYEAFHQPVFIRSNFGAELRFGNGPGADGLSMGYQLHPTHSPQQLSRYKQLGELAYVFEMKRQASEWIRANPIAFIRVSFARFVYYWTSTPWNTSVMPAKNALFLASSVCGFWGLWLMWRQRRPGFFLFAVCLLVFPLVYYFVFPHPRYRAPIEPELFTLIVFLFSQTKELRIDE
jgi:4-amino-4-deoxy-L-arabinose transferase-like glycosyltransferase